MSARHLLVSVMVVAGVVAGLAGPVLGSPSTITSRPQLESAGVWWTTSVQSATASNPAGTTLSYGFLGYSGDPDVHPEDFIVYTADGTPHRGDSVVRVGVGVVSVRFSDFVTPEQADAITLATVQPGAVVDDEGLTNSDGAVAVEYQPARTITRPVAPIRLVGARTAALRRHRTVMRLVFAVPHPPTSVTEGAFQLQLVDGRSLPAVHQVTRTKPGRAVVRVAFAGHFPTRSIARVTAAAGAVTWIVDYDDEGQINQEFDNDLQAAAISHHGDTIRPDLVRVRLQPSPDPRLPGHALFVFDQPVTRPRAGRFLLAPNLRVSHAVVRPHHPRQVRVTDTYWERALTGDPSHRASDAAVLAGAVAGGRADEVHITNTAYADHWVTSDGLTAGPDLVPHSPSTYFADLQMDHQSPNLTVAFHFDETDISQLQPAAFHLYLSDGTEIDASQCTVTTHSPAADVSEVRCTFTGLTADQAAAATVGTVDSGAVRDSADRVNPEGAGLDTGPLPGSTAP